MERFEGMFDGIFDGMSGGTFEGMFDGMFDANADVPPMLQFMPNCDPIATVMPKS